MTPLIHHPADSRPRRWIARPRGLAIGALLAVAAVSILSGCRRGDSTPPPVAPPPRVEEAAWGPIRVTLTFTPALVRLDQDVLLDIGIRAPEGMEVTLPPLDERLQGFAVSGRFERDPVTQDGIVTRELHIKLTPTVADEYRLAPLAATYTDRRVDPPLTGWFPTPPVRLDTAPLVDGDPGSSLNVQLDPVWIRPTARTVLAYLALGIAALALLAGLYKLLTRVREEVALRRLSPRERALRELTQLLARDLLARGLTKDFYVELTMVVRRYIERQHKVRAPEQTTEEFLQAVSRDPRFGAEVLARLRAFLQSADMVKFAAYQPGDDKTRQAVETARGYIEQDAAGAETPPNAKGAD